MPEELAPFHRVKGDLSCWKDDCVARGLCAVIPSTLRAHVLAMVHEGRRGIVRVKQHCRGLVWWPGIDRDIEVMVKDCTACLTSAKTGLAPHPPLQPLPWPPAPWTHIQVDICGELHGIPQHQRLLLVAYDLHSKWPEVLPVRSITTGMVTNFLFSLFARWGVPDAITTDNGTQFVSADFASFTEERGIKHIRTALCHMQANGGVERFNQTLKNGLRAHLADNLPLTAALQNTLLHYRATPHTTTGSSPALLMLGHELQLPLDRLRPPREGTPATQPSPSDTVARRQHHMKQHFDRVRRVRRPTLVMSDWVRIRRPSRSHKLLSFWSAPQQITAQLGPATFRLSLTRQPQLIRTTQVVTGTSLLFSQKLWLAHPPEPDAPAVALQPGSCPVCARQKPRQAKTMF